MVVRVVVGVGGWASDLSVVVGCVVNCVAEYGKSGKLSFRGDVGIAQHEGVQVGEFMLRDVQESGHQFADPCALAVMCNVIATGAAAPKHANVALEVPFLCPGMGRPPIKDRA